MLPSKVTKGDQIKAETLNKLIDEVAILQRITGGKGIGVSYTRSGIVIYLLDASATGSGKLPVGQYVGMGWFTVSNNVSAMAYPFAVATV